MPFMGLLAVGEFPFSTKAEKVAEGRMGCGKQGTVWRKLAAPVVQPALRRFSRPHPIRRHSPSKDGRSSERPFAPPCVRDLCQSRRTGGCSKQPPVAGSEPVATTAESCGEARDRSGVFLNPNSCKGARARTSKEGSGSMPQQKRAVGLDVAKN